MKKHIIILFLAVSLPVAAQKGYKHINLAYGYTTEEVQQFSIALEFNKANFDSWELYFEGQRDLHRMIESPTDTTSSEMPLFIRKVEELFQFGAIYEPLMAKGKNLLFSLRIGAGAGTDRQHFIASAAGGFELNYTFPGLLCLFVQQTNHYIINVEKRFRHGLTIGIKIPI